MLTFFLLLWVVMLLFALCGDLQFSFEISPYIDLFLDAGEVRIPSVKWSLTLELFILPPMAAIALGMVQMTLSLFMKPVFSYICSLVYLLASAYYTSPALLGNYAMVLRSEQVMENGVSPTVGVLYATVLAVLSAAARLYAVQKAQYTRQGGNIMAEIVLNHVTKKIHGSTVVDDISILLLRALYPG